MSVKNIINIYFGAISVYRISLLLLGASPAERTFAAESLA